MDRIRVVLVSLVLLLIASTVHAVTGQGVWIAFPNGTTCANYNTAPINDQTLCYDSVSGWQSFHSSAWTPGAGAGSITTGTTGQVATYTTNGNTLGGVGPGTTTTVLHGNAAGQPSYGTTVLTTDVSGLLPIANGGSNSTLAPVLILCKTTGNPAVDIVSSVTLTAVLSCSIPANTLGTAGVIYFTVVGDFLQNNGAGQTVLAAVNFGGTDIVTGTITNGASVNRLPMTISGWIINTGTTNSQYGHLYWDQHNNGQAAGALGAVGNDTVAGGYGTSAIDTTLTKTLAVNLTLGASSANLEFRAFMSITQVMKP